MKIRGGWFRIATCCALAHAALHATVGLADDFSILYHERLGDWSLGPDATSKSSAVQSLKPTGDSLLSFTAFGRQFRARLERNDLLLRGLSSEARSSFTGIDVFGGELVDVPNSWVRLTRVGRDISGAIFDGVELFAIDSAVRLAPRLRSPEQRPYTGPIVYRWRDTTGTLTDELRGLAAVAATDGPSMFAAAAAMLDPGRRLDLGLVIDAEFSAKAGSGAAGEALSRANLLDGILIFELGVHVNVAELTVFSQETDPFTAAEPQGLLLELEEYRATTPAQATQDLTHLLTGRDFSTNIIGIANLGTVCDARRGASLTESSNAGTLRDALIMAHELGHNFGAPHDGQTGPCQSTPLDYIMAPQFGMSQRFSACSIEQMQPELTSACLDVLAPADVELRTLSAPTDAVPGGLFQIRIAVDNPSAVDAYGVELTIEGTNFIYSSLQNAAPDGLLCSIKTATSAGCRMAALPRGRSVELWINARTVSAVPTTLSLVVHSLNDPDTADNVAIYTVAVSPIVDLVVDIAPAPEFVRVGQQIEYAATVRNYGTIAATNARAMVSLPVPLLNLVTLSTDVGTCAFESVDWYVCPLGSLAPGQMRSLSLRLRAIDSISTLSSLEYVQTSIEIAGAADQPNHGYSNRSKLITVAESVVDLQMTASPTQQFVVNTSAAFAHTVANAGPDVATDVVLYVNPGYLEQGVTDAVITSNVGTCQVVDRAALRFECRVPTLAVGQALVATVRGTASRLGLFSTASQAQARAYDPAADDNDSSTSYTVVTASAAQPPTPPAAGGGTTTAPAATGGGGGGATDPLWLLLLALALAPGVSRRRCRARDERG